MPTGTSKNPFKVGDKVRVFRKEAHFDWGREATKRNVGEEFVISEIFGDDHCREVKGAHGTGLHYELLGLVQPESYAGIKVGDRVVILDCFDSDLHGQIGVVARVDINDPHLPFFVESNGVCFWLSPSRIKLIEPEQECVCEEDENEEFSFGPFSIAEMIGIYSTRFRGDNMLQDNLTNNNYMNIKNKIKMLMTGEPEKH